MSTSRTASNRAAIARLSAGYADQNELVDAVAAGEVAAQGGV